MGARKVTKSRKKQKEDLVYIHGGACAICGYNRCQEALQFHHLNPDEKEFQLSGKTRSWEGAVAESKKCILICGNCHAELHAGVIEAESLVSSFDEDRFNEIEQRKAAKEWVCIDCGDPVFAGSTRCPKCAYEHKRLVERPDRDTLKDMIRCQSFCSIANEYGVTDNAVRKWCKSYNLPSRKTDINNIDDDSWQQL